MEKAYKKATSVINSCTNLQHTMAAHNYILLFENLFSNEVGCDELVRNLHIKCLYKITTMETI
jgi:hypothetical protein